MNFSESQFDDGSQTSYSPAAAVKAKFLSFYVSSSSSSSSSSSVLNYLQYLQNRDTFGLIPLTVKQISEASHSGDDKSSFNVSGVDVVNVSVVGMVFNIVERNLDVTFTIDDGTRKLDCKRCYIHIMSDLMRQGIYVHVDGHLKSYKGEKHVAVFSVRPLTNFDEITFHFIACIHNHMHTSKVHKIRGDGEYMNLTPNTPILNGANGFMSTQSSQISVPFIFYGVKGVDQMGVHTDELAKKLKLPINKIMESIRTLEDEGVIYASIDEFNYKAVEVD
ncbi:hypothetical protein SSX86_022871 [Deinandra increscens subsp. villosa]|uniref:Replication protein A C-terminal domain-containing protein n=1 Tax=Deinandra increscens subsp. villosa TaxID=3103831 RepID=A0AAP0CJU4_9ASTR